VTVAGPGPFGGSAGPSAQARFASDVLGQPGATAVILLEGINDIGDHVATAAQLIAADKQLIAQAHAAGLRILGGTLLPFQGAGYYSAAGERIREQVNAWIRTSGAFDGVLDFDKALRDPADPLRLLPAYDSGDHLHPSDAGYQAMADAIPLSLLR
jgi:lysophospholipase L1-like esterase